jgi:Zn-dependent protease
LPLSFIQFSVLVTIVNIALAVFNLMPIPPLDGSKVLFAFIPFRFQSFRQTYERLSLPILLVFIFVFSKYLGFIVMFLFSHLTGVYF